MNALMLIVAGLTIGQTEPGPKNAERAEGVNAWRVALDLIAKEHRIAPADRSDEPFRLIEKPVFVWSQPIRSGQIGSVYPWVAKNGRPGALAAVFCWNRTTEYWAIMHEFHSLADTPLKVTYRDAVIWTPAEPGLRWKALPIEAPVATSQARQLSQIRHISRRFQAYTVTPEMEQWQLRLLPRPLYEYTVDDGGSVLAGAVVALCQDMDPELVLVIEARQVTSGVAWHYACGTFTDYESHLSFGGQEIWKGAASQGEANLTPEKIYWREFITRRASPPQREGQPATWTE